MKQIIENRYTKSEIKELFMRVQSMAASEGLFDDRIKSEKALILSDVMNVLLSVSHGKDVSEDHGNPVMRDEIEKDVSQLIDEYKKFRRMASTNTSAYDNCKSIMAEIRNLGEFSEKYLGYKITIKTDHKGNQYVPDDILGFNISDQNKDEREVEDERE